MTTIVIEKNVMVPMRDGVQLATDIYRLEGASPTPVLDQPVEVVSPIELYLFVASSAPDTDFTGKLVDIHPNGRAIPTGNQSHLP